MSYLDKLKILEQSNTFGRKTRDILGNMCHLIITFLPRNNVYNFFLEKEQEYKNLSR